jgi:hypothetical protein
MIYPNCAPEFRVLVKADNTQVLQVRYVNSAQGYTGKWQDIPVVQENAASKP